jgi:hypothetical protein
MEHQEVMARLITAARHHPEPYFYFGRLRQARVPFVRGHAQCRPQPLVQVLGAQRLEVLRHKAVAGLKSRRHLSHHTQPGELRYVVLVRRLQQADEPLVLLDLVARLHELDLVDAPQRVLKLHKLESRHVHMLHPCR